VTTRWIDDAGGGEAAVRLFCFAHAGGGSGFFRAWRAALGPAIGVAPVVLPGRESRWREPAFTRMEPLLDAVCDAMQPYLDRPFALFGHSLGAAIAWEVARRFAEGPARHAPLCVFVSARRAPHLPPRRAPIHRLADDAFLAELQRLNGTHQTLIEEPSLLRALLPALRADFELDDAWRPAAPRPLAVPLSALAGDRDPIAAAGDVRRWSEVAAGEFSLRLFDGDHFYLADARAEVLDAIRYDLARALHAAREKERACTTT
jgi:surfactin synthase thioesterase subunit